MEVTEPKPLLSNRNIRIRTWDVRSLYEIVAASSSRDEEEMINGLCSMKEEKKKKKTSKRISSGLGTLFIFILFL